jgi:alkaline phosphatase D
MNTYVYVLLLLIIPEICYPQNTSFPVLTAGPLVGSVTTNSAKVWISYKGSGQCSVSLLDTTDQTILNPTDALKTANSTGDTSMILNYAGLKAGHCYKITHTLTSDWTPDCRFKTQLEAPVGDIDFLTGSCALLVTGFWRAFFPGADIRIYRHMARSNAEFMLWLGDNIYYLGKDYKSYDNMFARNIEVRSKFKLMRSFLAAQPNYAIWDDHDYGWNDADKKFPLKDSSLKVFRGFWPNTYENEVKQTYFTFRYSDADFFMTDGRWFRDTPGDTAGDFLGAEQLQWLKNKLLKSEATFKFICIGSQVINDNQHGESYAHYPIERNKLLDYIVDNNIKGVIFMTGDKHYTELSKRDWHGYTIYDFTSSPISSPVIPRKALRAFNNPYSVKGTVVYSKNYGRIKIIGTPGNRICKLETYGVGGKLRWDYSIKSEELSRKDKTSKVE